MNIDSDGLSKLDGSTYDVIIGGGGLAGLTLARQLRRNMPELRVLVLERTKRPLPPAAHKVGESSVELASQYFERLGLKEYLLENQLVKFGLRFFPGGGHKPLAERMEIGPQREPIVRSYQLDRGRLEDDLRGMVEDAGATLIEGVRVEAYELGEGGAPHRVRVSAGEKEATVTSRWVVDATGWTGMLRKDLKLTRGSGHNANAGWFRIKGKLDINDLVPQESRTWHDAEWAPHRWRSTNHLMGRGYWVWIIPLSTGNTSIGVVVHDAEHPFEKVRTLEKCMEFIETNEPVLHPILKQYETMDFLCMRGYSHATSRGWSPDRWALVGPAGAFVDPFYSPGSDFIAFANSFTEELIRVDLAGGDLDTRCRELNLQYRALVAGNVDLFRQAAPVYGHPRALHAKVYWDNFSYWSYPCHYFLQGLYKLTGADAAPFIEVGQRFVELSNYVQTVLSAWADLSPMEPEACVGPMPGFPSVLVDAHIALQNVMTPAETLAYMKGRMAEAEEIVGEIVLRALYEVGEDKARECFERAGVGKYRLRISEARLDASPAIGLARRRALSPIARDVERTLGRPRTHTSDATVHALVAPLLKPAAGASPEALGGA